MTKRIGRQSVVRNFNPIEGSTDQPTPRTEAGRECPGCGMAYAACVKARRTHIACCPDCEHLAKARSEALDVDALAEAMKQSEWGCSESSTFGTHDDCVDDHGASEIAPVYAAILSAKADR